MLFLAPTAVAPNMAPLGSLEMVAWLMFGELTVDNPSYTKRPVSCDAPSETAGELQCLPDLCVISRWIYVS